MSIERWHPFKDLEKIRNEMDRAWEDIFPTSRRMVLDAPWFRSSAERGAATPSIDLADKEDELVLKANLPGVKKEDIDISLNNDESISITGKIREEQQEESEHFFYSERSTASYSRTITLPCKVKEEGIKAALRNGVLSVHLPKLKESKEKKIKVEVS